MHNEKHALVALGANLPFGDKSPAETLQAAVFALESADIRLHSLSKFYATPCFPYGNGPDYVNAAAVLCVDRGIEPADLLSSLQKIEARFGRTRETRWGMRTLDLDLLAVADSVLPDPMTQRHWMELPPQDQSTLTPEHLILPHPRLQDRAFVLVPLADVAPEWRHPVLGRTVTQMLAALSPQDRKDVRLLA